MAVFSSGHVLPSDVPATVKCSFSWIYLAERSLQRRVRACGMAACVLGEHLEIKGISILTDGLNNRTFNQTQSKAAAAVLSGTESIEICPLAFFISGWSVCQAHISLSAFSESEAGRLQR